MKFFATLMIVFAAALPAHAGEVAPDGPPRLVHSVTITGDILKLGDIFANVGDKASVPIAYAPAPGQRAMLDADWLAETARRNDIDWRPHSPTDHVTVERASQTIGTKTIEAELLDALRNYGSAGELKLELDDRAAELRIPVDAAPTVAIRNLKVNEYSGRFSAAVLAPADHPTVELPITGRVQRVTEVPVLAHRIGRGDVIRRDDVTTAKIPVSQLGRDAIVDAKNLVGLEATRLIQAGLPIRAGDVRPQVLVPKDSLVTIVLRSDGMELTVQGKALDEGARGDTVRVMNTKSKRILEAQVDGPGTVVINPTGALAAN